MHKILKALNNEGLLNFIIRFIKFIKRKTLGRILVGKGGTTGFGLEIIGRKYITFGEATGFGNCSRIEAYDQYLHQKFIPNIKIGKLCSFGHFLHIGAVGNIYIGDGCLFGSNILIIDHVHGEPKQLHMESDTRPAIRNLVFRGDIKIGKNVWVADNVKIFGGSIIEDGAIISANSIVRGVVKKDTIFRND